MLIFSLELSSQTRFAKIKNKKVFAENQCEKHKKLCLVRLPIMCKHCILDRGSVNGIALMTA